MGKADRTKHRIIEEAAPLFNKKGVAGTSVDDVLEVAGITKRTFYKYFETKEAFSYQVTDYLLEKLKQRIEQALVSGSAKDGLFAYMEVYRYAYPEDAAHSCYIEGGCPILNFGIEADDTNTNILENVDKTVRSVLDLLERTINRGINDHEFSKDFNASHFSAKFFSQIEGATMTSRVLRNNEQMEMAINMLKSEIESYTIS